MTVIATASAALGLFREGDKLINMIEASEGRNETRLDHLCSYIHPSLTELE